jgi:ParB-like chromosome segregation protein Spo0J
MASKATKFEVKIVSVDDLQYDPENPRKHNDKNIQAIAASLKEFGQQRPIVVTSKGIVVAGNGTLEAARLLKWSEIAVHELPFDDLERARAYAIADNRSGDLSSWDEQVLYKTLNALDDSILESTGFNFSDLDDLERLLNKDVEKIAKEITEKATGTGSMPSLAELAEKYSSKLTRLVALEYQNAVYAWVQEKLGEYRKKNKIESNAQAILKLLEDATGEKAPKTEEE